jgi:hypothetical protein
MQNEGRKRADGRETMDQVRPQSLMEWVILKTTKEREMD